MLKKRIIAIVAGLALLAAVAGQAANVVSSLAVTSALDGQAVVCNNGGHSGGGC